MLNTRPYASRYFSLPILRHLLESNKVAHVIGVKLQDACGWTHLKSARLIGFSRAQRIRVKYIDYRHTGWTEREMCRGWITKAYIVRIAHWSKCVMCVREKDSHGDSHFHVNLPCPRRMLTKASNDGFVCVYLADTTHIFTLVYRCIEYCWLCVYTFMLRVFMV